MRVAGTNASAGVFERLTVLDMNASFAETNFAEKQRAGNARQLKL
jgi:hypothetical protein